MIQLLVNLLLNKINHETCVTQLILEFKKSFEKNCPVFPKKFGKKTF